MDQTLPKISREQFTAMYRALPENIKLSLFAEETAEKMMAMKNKYSLSDENFSSVVRITGRIMLGVINVKLFIQAIANIAKLDTQTAQAIAQDINQAIFQPVRNSLMQVHGLERDTNQMTNAKTPMTNQYQRSNDESSQPQTNNNYEAQKRREEVLNKLKTPRNNGPLPARPASYYNIPRRNVVNLKKPKRENKYNDFFST